MCTRVGLESLEGEYPSGGGRAWRVSPLAGWEGLEGVYSSGVGGPGG